MPVLAGNSQIIVVGILVVLGIPALSAGLLDHSKRTKCDYLLESISFFSLSVLVKPRIVLGVMFLGNSFALQYRDFLVTANFWRF